jgi:hypothetical protein
VRLEDYFTAEGLALPTDQAERLAAGRRQRRIGEVPVTLRPAAARFCEHMLAARQRARRAGTKPRTDHTIETALAIVPDRARFAFGRCPWRRGDSRGDVAGQGSGSSGSLPGWRIDRRRLIGQEGAAGS